MIWISIGGLILLGLLGLLMRVAFSSPQDLDYPGPILAAAVGGLVGGGFIYVGFRAMRGIGKDTLACGIASIILGSPLVLAGMLAVPFVWMESDWKGAILVGGGLELLFGGGLLVAGILAIQARDQYKAWRRSRLGANHSLRN